MPKEINYASRKESILAIQDVVVAKKKQNKLGRQRMRSVSELSPRVVSSVKPTRR